VWSNLMFGLRLEGLPGGVKVFCSSTPLPNPWTRKMVERESTVLVRGSSYENIDNVDVAFREQLDELNGTRIGRQEIYGELLEDVEGALWKAAMIRYEDFNYEDMERIVIAVDPAGTTNKRSDLTGIVVVGKIAERGYVIADLSGSHSPQEWANIVIRTYNAYKADAVVVETNFGGDMVRRNLQTAGFDGRIIESRAVRGKETRAEPVVTKYEQLRIWHSKEADQAKLVDEMLTWVPGTGPSPNRVDAMVWGFSELFKTYGESSYISPLRLGNNSSRGINKRINPIEALRRERMRS
jgi:phage terminase large subunit-like protein